MLYLGNLGNLGNFSVKFLNAQSQYPWENYYVFGVKFTPKLILKYFF